MANDAAENTILQGWFDAAEEDWSGLALASKQIRRAGAKYLEKELQEEMGKTSIEEYLKQHKAEIIKENLRKRSKIQAAKERTHDQKREGRATTNK